jgi:hypothetical protein
MKKDEIRQAVVRERRRCARVVWQEGKHWRGSSALPSVRGALDEAARMILKGPSRKS